jgi:uncharacterized protein
VGRERRPGRGIGTGFTGLPRWSALLVFLLGAACSSAAGPQEASRSTPPVEPESGSATATPSPTTSGSAPADAREPQGFSTVTVRITESDGTVCEVCVWLADSPEERARGLMEVTSLGPAAGMVFVFEEERSGSFYMFNTPTPLSIAWFGADGGLVGTADMDPCLDTAAGECPLYSPGVPYRYALEVSAGGLDDLGIGPGAVLEVVPGTEADQCPDT